MSKKIPNNIKLYKYIYNPNAGRKRSLLFGNKNTIEYIKGLLAQYQITVDFFPTKGPGDATNLAKDAIHEKYDTVIVGGGDGTISEAANGLVGSDIKLAILPLGSYMNTPRMLSIPDDLEKAVMLIKIGRTRKIDIGQITLLRGEKSKKPTYFLENSSIGVEAQLQNSVLSIERGNIRNFLTKLKSLLYYYQHKVKIVLDDKEIETHASMVSVSNGQFTGAALKLAPNARLNDHRLTVSVFHMSKRELFIFLYKLMKNGKSSSPKITRYQSTTVGLTTKTPKPVHADGQLFGTTPVSYKILPNALTVITGFPDSSETTLGKRAPLDL